MLCEMLEWHLTQGRHENVHDGSWSQSLGLPRVQYKSQCAGAGRGQKGCGGIGKEAKRRGGKCWRLANALNPFQDTKPSTFCLEGERDLLHL